MNKKLMILAAGALAALAFAALPAGASALEYTADCEGAAVCTGTVAGGASQLRNDKEEGISCTAVNGAASVTNASATGTLELNFTGCVETITGFKFKCNSPTGAAGEVKTGAMVTHLIYLEPNKGTPGIKVTLPAAGVTFTCAGFSKKTVTDKVIGHISNPNCNTFQASHTADFAEAAGKPGVQQWMQATTTGPTTDLTSNNHAGGVYTTSAQIGSGVITWAVGHKVKLTC
jgi:hypothetical protein